MLFYDWLMKKYEIQEFSMEYDFKMVVEKDKYFPSKSKSYYDIVDYMISRQMEIPTYFNGYCVETIFCHLWDLYKQDIKKLKETRL